MAPSREAAKGQQRTVAAPKPYYRRELASDENFPGEPPLTVPGTLCYLGSGLKVTRREMLSCISRQRNGNCDTCRASMSKFSTKDLGDAILGLQCFAL